jgi:hypothetical protein
VKAVGVCGNGWLCTASVVGLWARPNGENYCRGRGGQGALVGWAITHEFIGIEDEFIAGVSCRFWRARFGGEERADMWVPPGSERGRGKGRGAGRAGFGSGDLGSGHGHGPGGLMSSFSIFFLSVSFFFFFLFFFLFLLYLLQKLLQIKPNHFHKFCKIHSKVLNQYQTCFQNQNKIFTKVL